MPIEQTIITWIHLVSAAIWVGGSLFIGVVLAPVLKRSSMPLEERLQMMITVGRRFNRIAIPSLIILIGTGLYTSQNFFTQNSIELLFSTSYGNFLLIKIILVILLLVTFAVHVRIIRKDVEDKIMNQKMSAQQIQTLRKKIIILGEITVIISVAILFFAALLDSGF